MTAAELITHLRMLDVTLAVDGEQLRVNAPKGVLGPELRDAIAQAKPELLAWLAAEPRRSEMSEAAPLSFAQQRMWLLDQMQDDTTASAYVIRGALRLQGPLDVAVLRRALDTIARRHAVLRTTFRATPDGEPVQQVHPAAPVPLEEIDLRPVAGAAAGADDTAIEAAIEAAARDWGRAAFDLEHGPVFRVALMRCADHDHLLLTAAHHIVSDGWSSGVFARELCALYTALARGEGDPLPPLPLQYADHARWQRRTLQGEALQRQLDHWRTRLAEPRAVLDLPSDRPRPPRQSFAGAECVLPLPDDLPARLRDLAESEQVTTFMLLMTAFQAWLSRTSGQHDILVGTPVAQRDHLAVEGLIGFFANTLVLRSDLSDAPTLRALLRHVKADLLAAQAHQAVPFEKLVEELNPERDPSRNPLFQAMLMLQRVDDAPVQLPGLVASVPRWTQATTAKFDLTAVFRERQGRLELVLEYSTDLFDAATAETMARRLACLLDAGLRDPDAPVDTLPLIDTAETTRLLAQAWGPRSAPSMTTLPERVMQQAQATPERIAVSDEAGALTYGDLVHEARRVATALRALGVRPGDRVAVCTGRSAALVSALLGVWGCAAAYVPLDPDYPPERIAHVLDDAGAAALVAHRALAERLARPGLPVLDLDAPLPAPDDAAWQQPAPQDLAYVIYTSGSTGRPKGVEIEHAALANFIEAMRDEPGLHAHDVVLAITTIAFDIAGLELWLPLCVGARVHVAPAGAGRDPQLLQTLLSHTRATLLQATPSTWRLLVESGWSGDAALVALCGGEALPGSLAAALVERVGALWNMYGPTETTIWSAAHRVRPGEAVVLGRPMRNTCFHVLDARGGLLPDGLAGELWIGGLGLARGYHGRPDLSAERFRPDPFEAGHAPGSAPAARLYRTGDRVRRRHDGTLVYLGRLDHQVKLRGYRIEPGEIESLLMQQPGVREALVIVREDSPGDQQLVAYVTPVAQALLDPGALKDALRHSLPDYMVPAAVVQLPALPLTPNGKVDRAGLPAPVGAGAGGAAQADTTLRSPTEEALAAIWRDVLHVAEVGPAGDFFDLGGHSLLATQVASRIRLAFEVELPLAVLFEARTLEQLAHRIDDAVRHARHAELLPRIPPSRDDGPVRLSFSQERMWVIHQLAPGNLAYNMAVAVGLRGPLAVTALSEALDGLRERHEPLRSVYRLHDGVPVQEVLPWQPEALAVIDLAPLGEAAMAQALEQAQALARQPFDLAHGPVLRLGLWRVAEQAHLLAIVLHHIAGDHWSFSVMAAEIGQAYAARRAGRTGARPPLPIRYRDYARWQRDWLQGEVLERQMAYWRDQLEGLAPLALPFDRPFPDAPTFIGGRHEVALPEGLLPRLEALARREGATLFMTSFAAFVALLHRVNGQDDLALGVPIANRTQADTEGLVGTFVNTLVMRVGLGGADTFTELLRRVRGVALDAYAHQDMPFEKLVEALVRQRDAQRAPLVQVLFNVQNAPLRTAQIDELLWEPVSLHRGAAQFELSVALSPREGGRLTIEYSAQLFDHDTVDQLIRSYLEVLQAVAADPGATVAALPLLSAGQREQLDAWNRTEAALPPPGLTHLRLQALARSEPDRVAATCGSDRLSLGQLDQRAEALAQHLRALGVASGVLVGVCLPRSLDMLVALLAVQKSGGAYVPLDPGFPEDRLSYMLADSGAPVLLTWGDTAQGVDLPAGLQVVDLQQPLPPSGAGEREPQSAAPAPQDPAYVIYTSGSTGKPKGVAVPHGALANFLASMAQAPGLQPDDVLAAVTTISFDIAALELYLPLVVGARVDIVARETAVDGPALAQRLAEVGATVLQATPATWRLLIEADWRGPAGFKALCGGEGLPRDLADALLERVGELWNLYGPTETTVWSTTERVGPGKGAVSIGRPIANTQVHVLDRHGQRLPAGMPGELWIGGAGVALGYHRRPELTAERFVPDPFDATGGGRLYRTGDLGRWRHDGRLEHLGRLDHQVKVRGFRIELGEIEVALQAHEQVQQAVVVAREAAPGDLRLVAYVLFQPGGDLTASEVRRHLRRDLPDYMVPSVVVTLDHIPLTPNGKVDRLALPDPFKGAAAVRREHEPPAPGLEQQLAEIWRSVLQVERVGAGDNFFELGGHSLLSLRVVAAVERELGWRMDPRTLFFQTLRDVAATGARALATQAPGPAGAAST